MVNNIYAVKLPLFINIGLLKVWAPIKNNLKQHYGAAHALGTFK